MWMRIGEYRYNLDLVVAVEFSEADAEREWVTLWYTVPNATSENSVTVYDETAVWLKDVLDSHVLRSTLEVTEIMSRHTNAGFKIT